MTSAFHFVSFRMTLSATLMVGMSCSKRLDDVLR
jgi:hypothetical protein